MYKEWWTRLKTLLLTNSFEKNLIKKSTIIKYKNLSECRLVDEAKTFHLLPDRRDSGGERTRPRMSAGTTQVSIQICSLKTSKKCYIKFYVI